MLKEGMSLTLEKIVSENETAAKIASGALNVFATPILMENASFELVQKELPTGETTVGTSVNIKHLKANLIGDKIKCVSVLEKIDGKKLEFSVKVYHGDTLVGEGTHGRFIVNEEKFLNKLKG